MALEIERKFLVVGEFPATRGVSIAQGYLNDHPSRTVRVRITDDHSFITIKGRPETGSISRPEFEYEIPLEDGKQMMELCNYVLTKTRYHVPVESGHTIEVDVFHGENTGLIVAEVELNTETEVFTMPDWLGKEVTDDIRYANSRLAKSPWSLWTLFAAFEQLANEQESLGAEFQQVLLDNLDELYVK